MRGVLLVRAEGVPYGFPVADVVQVLDLGVVHPAPAVVPAVRGVTLVDGRPLPLVHLAALLDRGEPPEEMRLTGVVARCGRKRVVFEVDDADAVMFEDPLPAPGGWRVPWVSGVVPGKPVVPILDAAALGERLGSGAGTGVS